MQQRRERQRGLTALRVFWIRNWGVGCSACFAAGFQWSGGHQGGDDVAKHQHFKIKPFTVRSQLLCPPSPSESSTFLLQRTQSWGALLAINLVAAPTQSSPASLGLMKSSPSTAVHVACNYYTSIRLLWCKFKNSSGKLIIFLKYICISLNYSCENTMSQSVHVLTTSEDFCSGLMWILHKHHYFLCISK